MLSHPHSIAVRLVTLCLSHRLALGLTLGWSLGLFPGGVLQVGVLQAQTRPNFRTQREAMVVDSIEREGITNPLVLQAMRAVERHEFVVPALRPQAYIDMALAIGHQQTISPPFVVAYMTETLDPQPTDRVLEIGTGSGYQAAVLGEIVDQVYSIEIVEPLGRSAADRLRRLGYKNVECRVGDGYLGWPERAPFDKIIVTCSPEKVPEPLVEQLKEGGRMIIPLGERYQQVFHLLEKQDGKLVTQQLIPTLFVPMTGQSEKQREVRPDPLHPQILNGDFNEDENADGLPDHWHYQRQTLRVPLAQATPTGQVAPPATEWCLQFENAEPGRLSQALQGMAIDGQRITSLSLSVDYRLNTVRSGPAPTDRCAMVIHFYDAQRKVIGEHTLGPWSGSEEWATETRSVAVPSRTREMIVRVGLNGATGRLWIDRVKMTPRLSARPAN